MHHYVGLLSDTGEAFLVKASANPTNPWQKCTVANANDTMKGANVTNVSVTCTTTKYNVGGKVVGMGASKGRSSRTTASTSRSSTRTARSR